jgi:hypothetical protein
MNATYDTDLLAWELRRHPMVDRHSCDVRQVQAKVDRHVVDDVDGVVDDVSVVAAAVVVVVVVVPI